MRIRPLALLWIPLALNACAMPGVDETLTTTTPSNQLRLESNRVMPSHEVVDIMFEPDAVALSSDAMSALATALEHAQSVHISVPANDKLAEKRKLTITRFLRSRGMPSTAITSERAADLDVGAYVAVAEGYVVYPPNCPNWTSSSTTNATNQPFSNMGCALATNLGQQAANPAHLMQGEGNVRPDGARNGVALDAYRSNATPAGWAEGPADQSEAKASQSASAPKTQ